MSRLTWGHPFLIRLACDNKPISSYQQILASKDVLLPASHFRSGGISVNLYVNHNTKVYRWIVKPKKKYTDYWTPHDLSIRPMPSDLTYKRNRGFFAIDMQPLVSYSKIWDLKRQGKDIGKHRISLVVKHKPTSINYWHCEIVPYACPVEKVNGVFVETGMKQPVEELSSKTAAENIGSMLLGELESTFLTKDSIKGMSLPRTFFTITK